MGTRGWPCTWATGTPQSCVPPLCGSCTSRLCFSLYSPPTPPVASREYTDGHYSDRARSISSDSLPLFPSQQPRRSTHTHAHTPLPSMQRIPFSKKTSSQFHCPISKPVRGSKFHNNMIVTPFALLSFSRGREPLFHSAAAIKNIYTSYETTSRNIRRASRMHEY